MKETGRRNSLLGAFAVLLVAAFFILPRGDEQILQFSGYTMGTTFHLQLVGMPADLSQLQVEQDIIQLLERLDRQLFSTYVKDSELSRFNRADLGMQFSASAELLEVVSLAQEISSLTSGAFDITVGPLVNLWGFGPEVKIPAIPDEALIDAALARVGYQHLRLDIAGSWIARDADVYVDLSAIAKGYAVDVLADYLDAAGVAGYFLEVGGELKIKGFKPDQKSWVPAIERPVDSAPQIYEILNSRGEELAIAGSGDYRNYFEENTVRYSHEIDPRSGKPINHNLAAVYVIDSSAARADALATAFMVMGFDPSMSLAQKMEQAVYFIVRTADGNFTSYHTDQFERYITREG